MTGKQTPAVTAEQAVDGIASNQLDKLGVGAKPTPPTEPVAKKAAPKKAKAKKRKAAKKSVPLTQEQLDKRRKNKAYRDLIAQRQRSCRAWSSHFDAPEDQFLTPQKREVLKAFRDNVRVVDGKAHIEHGDWLVLQEVVTDLVWGVMESVGLSHKSEAIILSHVKLLNETVLAPQNVHRRNRDEETQDVPYHPVEIVDKHKEVTDA